MGYALGAVERAMKVRDVILQALAGKLTWIQAAGTMDHRARRRATGNRQHATTKGSAENRQECAFTCPGAHRGSIRT
jgi:hypothetical protein